MTTTDQRITQFLDDLRQSGSEPIDIEAFPEGDEICLSGWRGVLIHGRRPTRVGDLTVPVSDLGDIVSAEDLCRVVSSCWPASETNTECPIYLRLHDSASSYELPSCEEVEDVDRPDRVAPPRRPFRCEVDSRPQDPIDGEQLRRDDPVSRVEELGLVESGASSQDLDAVLEKAGMRLMVQDQTIIAITYFAPFPKMICGIWIGASAWQVHEVLGTALEEFTVRDGDRAWRYRCDGHLSVGFDGHDRVSSISR